MRGGFAGRGSRGGIAGFEGAETRTVQNGTGTISAGGTFTGAAFALEVTERPLLAVHAYASGVALDLGPGLDVDARLQSTGVAATQYVVVIQNNSASTIAYSYSVIGAKP